MYNETTSRKEKRQLQLLRGALTAVWVAATLGMIVWWNDAAASELPANCDELPVCVAYVGYSDDSRVNTRDATIYVYVSLRTWAVTRALVENGTRFEDVDFVWTDARYEQIERECWEGRGQDELAEAFFTFVETLELYEMKWGVAITIFAENACEKAIHGEKT